MANPLDRIPENAAGKFYVDDTCIDCDLCRSSAPAFFKREEILGQSVVFRQPVTADEIAVAEQAMAECPTDSIGNNAAPTPGS